MKSKVPIPHGEQDRHYVRKTKRHLKVWKVVVQLYSGREHPPRDMSSSETSHCYGGIDNFSPIIHLKNKNVGRDCQ
eukprot:gene17166-biopygen4886